MNYITRVYERESKSLIIPPDFTQLFKNRFERRNVGKVEVIKMKQSNELRERDVHIAKFLFNFTFATARQISRELSLQNGEDSNSVQRRIDKLVENRILNKFILKRIDDGFFPGDALEFYCLDLGGRYLLSQYSTVDVLNWRTTVNMMASELIGVSVATTEFYLRLKEDVKDRVIHFTSQPKDWQVNAKNVAPDFEFSLKDGLHTRSFVGQFVRGYDFPVNIREKAIGLNDLLMTNAWRKYFYDDDSPILLVIGDTDLTTKQAGKVIHNATEIKRVRYSTDERFQSQLSSPGAFLRYSPENDILQAIEAKIFY